MRVKNTGLNGRYWTLKVSEARSQGLATLAKK